MTERNYVTEMRAVIDREASGEYVSALVAREIVEKLRVNDPDLLIGWLSDQATALIQQAINERDRSRRSYARTAGPRSVFKKAADEMSAGQPAKMVGLLGTHYVVNEENLRKPLGSMTGSDLAFVSGRYHERSMENALEAAFFDALARKVGSDQVSDHFTDEQLTEMRKSLRG